jgi:hypothetical protein
VDVFLHEVNAAQLARFVAINRRPIAAPPGFVVAATRVIGPGGSDELLVRPGHGFVIRCALLSSVEAHFCKGTIALLR